jgi:hypothetical protein
MNYFGLGCNLGQRETLRRKRDPGDDLDVVPNNQLLGNPPCIVRHTRIVAADHLNGKTGRQIRSVNLLVKPGSAIDAVAERGKGPGQRRDETDLEHVVCLCTARRDEPDHGYQPGGGAQHSKQSNTHRQGS